MIEDVPHIKLDVKDAVGLVANPECKQILSKINSEYLYWDKVKYLAPAGIAPDRLWNAVKFQRSVGLQTVSFGKYSFHFNITPVMQSLLHEFDLNFGGTFSSDGIIPNKERQIYLLSSIMEEAIASSQMEGASTTRKVAKDMLRKQKSPENKSQQMIVNNYNTIRQLVEMKNEDLTIPMLLDVHHSISEHTLDNPFDEGQMRKDDNIVVMDGISGEVAHTPPPVSELQPLMENICEFVNAANTDVFIHPIVKGMVLHFMLAWVHPFVDGNGRTARSLVYWYMLKNGYWMTEYLSISRIIYRNKKRYERMFLYAEADGMDITYFILYNLQVMRQAFKELKIYLARKMEEHNMLLSNGIEGLNERQNHIMKLIKETPSLHFTAKEVAVRFSVSEKTARNDLQELVALNYLRQVQVNKKKSAYICVVQ